MGYVAAPAAGDFYFSKRLLCRFKQRDFYRRIMGNGGKRAKKTGRPSSHNRYMHKHNPCSCKKVIRRSMNARS